MSADYCLGVPYNIASYALFQMMIAQVTGMAPRMFYHVFGDSHIYSNHRETFLKEQYPRIDSLMPLPKMKINPSVKNIDDFVYEDFTLENYTSHPKVNYDIAT